MGKKILFNTLYNIGIFICLLIGYTGITDGRFEYIAVAVFIGAIFVILKIKLVKEIKSSIKK